MLSRLITHILYHIAGGLSTILSERYVKKFSHSFHMGGGGRPGALCVRFVKIGRNLFHIKINQKAGYKPCLKVEVLSVSGGNFYRVFTPRLAKPICGRYMVSTCHRPQMLVFYPF